MTRAEKAALEAYPAHDGATEQWKKAHLSSLAEYIQGYEQAEKDTIARAHKWLFSHLPFLVDYYNEDIHERVDRTEFIKLFRTQMQMEDEC